MWQISNYTVHIVRIIAWSEIRIDEGRDLEKDGDVERKAQWYDYGRISGDVIHGPTSWLIESAVLMEF